MISDFDDYEAYMTMPKPLPIVDYELKDNGCILSRNGDDGAAGNGRYSGFSVQVYGLLDDYVPSYLERIVEDVSILCRSQISKDWLRFQRLERDIDLVFVLTYSPDKYDESMDKEIGFALCKDNGFRTSQEDNSLYIDTICANAEYYGLPIQGGKALLNAIAEFAANNNNDYLTLNALVHVINYYRKFGFRFLKLNQQEEDAEIARLANMNASRKITRSGEANRQVMLERAIRFSREVDEEGKPVLNRELLKDNLVEELGLSSIPTDGEVEQYLSVLPEHVKQDGTDGVHDLYFALIKKGYVSANKCHGITRRMFVRKEEVSPEVWRNWITCEDGGYLMRKPLYPSLTPNDPELADPIIRDCVVPTYGGNKRRTKPQKALKSSTKRQSRKANKKDKQRDRKKKVTRKTRRQQ